MTVLNLNLKKSNIKICLDGDENRCFEFNPNDINLQGRIKAFYVAMSKKVDEYQEKASEFDDELVIDESGNPTEAGLKIIDEQVKIGEFVSENFDNLFGENTFERLFDNEFDPYAVGQVLEFAFEQFGSAREQKLKDAIKQTPEKSKKVLK
jgi:hypothetical protein